MAIEVDKTSLENRFNLPLAIGRLNPLPVDADYIQETYELAQNFAATDPTAYVGQLVYAKDTAKVYKIKSDGTLEELGGAAAIAGVEGRVSTLENTVGDASTGLVKKVADNEASITALDSGKLKNTTDTFTGTLSIAAGTGEGNEGNLSVAKDITAGGNVSATNLTLSGNLVVNGKMTTLDVENVSSKDNIIELASGRDTTTGITSPVGIEVKNYKGTAKTGQLVFKNDGIAYVGDSDDLQAIATRDNPENLTDGNLLKWNASTLRIEDSGKKISDFALDSDVVKSVQSDILDVSSANGVVTITPAAAKAEGKIYSSNEVPASETNSLKYNGVFAASKVLAGEVELTGNKGTLTSVVVGDGLTGGTITETGTIAHAKNAVSSESIPDTASGSLVGTGRKVISGISWDAFGHISGVQSTTLDDSDTWRPFKVNNAEVVGSDNSEAIELVSGSNITMAVSEDHKITISSTDTNTWRDIQIKGATIGAEANFNITSETGSGIDITTKAENAGTAFISHSDSTVTAGTYGVDATEKAAIGFGESFIVPTFTVDKKGHLTAAGTKSITLPTPKASENTTYDLFVGEASSTANATATNGNVNLHLLGNDNSDDKVSIVGSGAAKVTCSDGIITINTPEQVECKDENVKQTEFSGDGARPVLMSAASTPTSGGKAEASYSTAITATGTGTLTASKFVQGTSDVLDASMILILDGGGAAAWE